MLSVPNDRFLAAVFNTLVDLKPYATSNFNGALFDEPVLLHHAIIDAKMSPLLQLPITVKDLKAWPSCSRGVKCDIRPDHSVHLTGKGIHWHFCYHRHNDKSCVKMHVGAAVYNDMHEFVKGVHVTKSAHPSMELSE